jgi:3'-phosphoadenosine 5'-phosphosulfate sulfotransferase (PAPS reductase)/FAD synthetase
MDSIHRMNWRDHNIRLGRLEAEAIHILREAVAEFRSPVMLYSIGKDSSAMPHLAQKAFHPAKPPVPLLHVDTTWKFREMIAFRDETAARLGLDLLVHVNQEGIARGVSPVSSGSAVHTQVMKTVGLRCRWPLIDAPPQSRISDFIMPVYACNHFNLTKQRHNLLRTLVLDAVG